MSDQTLEVGNDQRTVAGGLRAAREAMGISQRELAARVNVSPSMISQIEAGQSQPSVNTLYAIVTELDVSMDELFGHRPGSTPEHPPTPSPDPQPLGSRELQDAIKRAPTVIRSTDRPQLRLESGVKWERLASPDTDAIDFMEVVYDVGGSSSRDGTLMRHNSVEVAVILSGALDVQVGFDTHHLGPGDSIAFDSTVPHRLWNPGNVPARAVWLVLTH